MHLYFLKTNRLGFRNWHENDLPLALQLWGDHDVTRFIDARGRLNEEQVKEKLLNEIDCFNQFSIQYFPIFLLNNNDFVGCCGLRPYQLIKSYYEIGFHINKKFWRQGLAKEAADAMINYAFNKLEAVELFAGHNPKNEGSKFLLNKLGFQYSQDEYYPPTGLNHPSYILSAERFHNIRE